MRNDVAQGESHLYIGLTPQAADGCSSSLLFQAPPFPAQAPGQRALENSSYAHHRRNDSIVVIHSIGFIHRTLVRLSRTAGRPRDAPTHTSMATSSGNGFSKRHGWALALGAAVAAILILVLVYRITAPRSGQTTTASGEPVPESDVLQVGALPVT